MNLIDINNLSVSFKNARAVRNVSMVIKQGEFVSLIGPSGSGKSTIGQAILKLHTHATYQGAIYYKGKNIFKLDEKSLNQIRGLKIAMIFQEPMTSLNPVHTVGKQIGEMVRRTGEKSAVMVKKRVLELLTLMELDDIHRIYHSFSYMLSGGQRQRVMIAMALAGKPDVLIADEPTTALDVIVQAQIVKLLKKLQEKLHLAILFITHDLDLVYKYTNHVYVMHQGVIISKSYPPYNKRNYREFVPFNAEKVVLDVENIHVKYQKLVAVDKVSFKLSQGQTMGIVGGSGSGKSSIAQALVRLIDATGKVMVLGRDFFALKGKELVAQRANMQLVMQDGASSLNPRHNIYQLVSEGLLVHRKDMDIFTRIIEAKKILRAVGLDSKLKNRYIHELSGGQKMRVALARALIINPKVIILDEVMASLDSLTQNNIIKLLLKLQRRFGLVYVFIAHDMKLIKALCDYVIVLNKGIVVEQNTQHAIFTNPQNEYTKKLLADSFFH